MWPPLLLAAGLPVPEEETRPGRGHASPYPGAPGPPAWYRRWWPVVTSVTSWVVALVLLATDLYQDWDVSPGAMPAYAALFAVGAAGGVLGRK